MQQRTGNDAIPGNCGLVAQLSDSRFAVHGKSLNKDEFVTCGGVRLRDVDLKTMESRLVPGLYFAGEVLDIDGVTGGFNFQRQESYPRSCKNIERFDWCAIFGQSLQA